MEPDPKVVLQKIFEKTQQVIPKLNDTQLDRLSEILANIGLVFFASLVVPVFGQDVNTIFMWVGLALSFGSWLVSLFVIRGRGGM